MPETDAKERLQILSNMTDSRMPNGHVVYPGPNNSLVVEYGKHHEDSVIGACNLINKLQEVGLIEGDAKQPSMDTVMYTLKPNDNIKVGDNVVLSIHESGYYNVSFSSTKPVEDVITALGHGVERAHADNHQRAQQQRTWVQRTAPGGSLDGKSQDGGIV